MGMRMSAAPRPLMASVNGWNAAYLDAEYARYRADPLSVDSDMRAFFKGYEIASTSTGTGDTGSVDRRAADLISAYRDLGHLAAKLDPFGRDRDRPLLLGLEPHGLSDADLDDAVDGSAIGLGTNVPLREVRDHLEQTYCGTIGAEVMHILDAEQRAWLLEKIERPADLLPRDRGTRVHVLEQLMRAELFERFLGRRYRSEKRFSLEGSESLVPLLDQVIEHASDLGVEEVVLGMAHRGRLNVLNNILGKTYEQIFTEFEDTWEEDFVDGGGDVKYHRGYSGTRSFQNGRMIHLAMASNPSHLESVDAVVLGRCRAKQRLRNDTERRRVIPLLIHGDAAISGQGIVCETLNFSQLEGYETGGAIHVVVNNMIGFTTSPDDARSSCYCTDVAKSIDAPILHVNAEDPEAVYACARLAIEYRQTFRRDIFIDMWCYRRYGHNEQDEQSFTQPILAKLIKNRESTLTLYAERLLKDGVLNEDDMAAIQTRYDTSLEEAQTEAKQKPFDPTIDPGSARWAGIDKAYSFEPVETGVDAALLTEICEGLAQIPDGFGLNSKLKKVLEGRRALPESGEISYADGETLAYGSLLLEGIPIRVSGQDSRRGTFSHRHAVLRDQKTGEPYTPLNHIREMGIEGTGQEPGSLDDHGRKRQAKLCIYDSPLSEASVMGFDYGYSLADPNMLVLWEAQFGDFANGAQVIIDQYLASAGIKWQRWSGLVLLLPHGYEGAGPEHSSARLERFLQLCGDHNMEVVHPTTGAQIFHLLRRQIRRPFRLPLVVMTPKSLLRVTTSTFADLTTGSFREIIDDEVDPSGVKSLVFCSGKIYYELDARRRELGRTDVAIIRIEQLHPFHADLASSILSRYPRQAERIWVQEEPRNMGAYHFIRDRFLSEFDSDLRYIGRSTSATPASGSKKVDRAQQEAIVTAAIGPRQDAGAEAPASKTKVSASV
ncbi:MAG: 2-oxoglutarate dehydrogenase E1 component [Phycisphaerales bacterium]|nr:2-oxoglutarate dehydrogenase E1 component [Phycisphaerales bacterium]